MDRGGAEAALEADNQGVFHTFPPHAGVPHVRRAIRSATIYILTAYQLSDGSRVFQESADDAALVRRCLEGETAAFEALVAEYQRLVFTVALRMLGDYEDARDATQTTFVKAFEKLASHPGA